MTNQLMPRSRRFAMIAMTVLVLSVLAWVVIQYSLIASEWVWMLYISAIPIGLLVLILLDRRADPVDAESGASNG